MNYVSTLFQNVRHERSVILLLSSLDEGILRQAGIADHELNVIKDLALEKLHRQKALKHFVALQSLD